MATNKDAHLGCVLDSHRMVHVETLVEKHRVKRREIKEALERHYGSKMYAPMNSGSYAKHTAINIKFDLDAVAPFKRDAFSTLGIMFEDVFDFFNKTYKKGDKTLKIIRKQTVSIGLIFNDGTDKLDIDIVPGRELIQDNYSDDKSLNLHINTPERVSMQTNIEKQIDHIKGKSAERECIRLLKIWKTQKNRKIKSFFIELITIRAFKNANEIPTGIWNKLEIVMEYIRDNVETIKLLDPGNGSNIVSDTLTKAEKKQLSNDMKTMLDRINYNSDHIKTYFKPNSSFPCPKYNQTGAGSAVLGTSSFG